MEVFLIERILAICDTDFTFATRLMEYLKSKKDFIFDIIVFSDVDHLIGFIKSNKIEMLLLSEDIMYEPDKFENIKYTCYLTDSQRKFNHPGSLSIYKYQKAQNVLLEILSLYKRQEDHHERNNISCNVQIISILALVPSAEKSIFSWSLSYLLSATKKVLFIPLEVLPCSLNFMGQDTQAISAISELIYSIKSDSDNKEESNSNSILKSLSSYYENLVYLYGTTHGYDLLSLNQEEVIKWIQELKQNKDFEYIIFYLNYYGEAPMEIVNQSDSQYVIQSNIPYESTLFKEWERQVKLYGYQSLMEKVNVIMLPEEDEDSCYKTLEDIKQSKAWATAVKIINEIT